MKKYLLPGFLVFLASFGVSASVPSPQPASQGSITTNPDDSDLGVYMLRNEDLNPSLAACLTGHGLGYCLKANLILSTANPEKTDTGLDPAWTDFLKRVIGVQNKSINTNNSFGTLGGSLVISRLDNDEIVSDPNKVATDQKAGTPGIWVRNLVELVPQIGDEQSFGKDDYGAAILSFHGVLRITHRHPMDQVYNDSFSGFTRSEIKIAEQFIPLYWKVPSHLLGSGMLPGEGIEVERYDAVEIGAGPLAELFGDPSSWYIKAGIFGSIGPVATFVRGHFRTIMEVQTDQTVRVELEKISEETEKLQGQIDVGLEFSPATIMSSLINIEESVSQAHKKIFDMSFDTSFEPAAHALRMAYLGKFSDALNLAANATSNYQGVRLLQTSTVKENGSGHDFQVFFFDDNSELTHDDVATTKEMSTTPEYSTVESLDKKRSSLIAQRELELSFQNSGGSSLSVKYRLSSQHAKSSEIQEYLDLARVLGPPAQQTQAASFPTETKSRTKLKGYFYLSLDTQAFAPALNAANGDGKDLITAWATVLNLPNPEQWATLSPDAQEELASKIPGAKDHLHHLRNFVKALKKTLQNDDSDKQARFFVKSFRGDGTDLYPIAALALLADKTHIMTLEHLATQTSGAAPSVLHFESIGSHYINPNQLLD